jgi:hypothetical protein
MASVNPNGTSLPISNWLAAAPEAWGASCRILPPTNLASTPTDPRSRTDKDPPIATLITEPLSHTRHRFQILFVPYYIDTSYRDYNFYLLEVQYGNPDQRRYESILAITIPCILVPHHGYSNFDLAYLATLLETVM